MAPPRQRKHVNASPPVQLVGPQPVAGSSSAADDSSTSITGVTVSVHPVWPDMQFTQGLLLGWRVTKCFWKTPNFDIVPNKITELVATIAADKSTFVQSTLTVIEYAIVKTPLMTLIVTSFLFRLILYVVVFYSELVGRWRRFRKAFAEWCSNDIDIAQLVDRSIEPPPAQLDLDSVLHMCSSNPVQIREEVSLLLEDMYLRLKRSLFAGVSTAFLSIFLPCVFVPYKTSLGVPQKVLVDEAWESELCIVVALTAFSLYITYLMPLNYLDLLHRSAVHLGTWDQIEGPKIGQTGQAKKMSIALEIVRKKVFGMIIVHTPVILGRIYEPSPEDLALIQQIQQENRMAH
ncbi:hypothetical protein ANCCEY_09316 [Ancylostoma ceylanicum]|uniref:Uncharacterized protein n=1 Tax=Ancylostoma ceylanicum TaxID=53326 RepID=A0A0D6LVC9_9BILA|nr:hypothetical protein ANCCEY_09316 [Ancylostoma ceylanicum]